MQFQVLTHEQIRREAQNAAGQHSDVNDACRFPFDSDAGQIFRAEFLFIRQIIAKAIAREVKP